MNAKKTSPSPRLSSPGTFFAVTFGWTWLFWLLAASLRLGANDAAGGPLLGLGMLGPMLAGIGLTYLTQDKEGRHDYWRRLVDFRRISPRWYLTILLFVPILIAIAALLDVLLGGSGGTWGEVVVGFQAAPWAIIPSALFAFLFPFIEELGWRGYVLDRLQERWTALASGIILGILWSLWHLPLFFIPETYQYGLGFGTPAFWLFMVGVVPLTIVFSWIFNNTSRSTLAVILMHAMVNFTGEVFAVTERADAVSILLWVLAAIGIVVMWGASTLTGRRQSGRGRAGLAGNAVRPVQRTEQQQR